MIGGGAVSQSSTSSGSKHAALISVGGMSSEARTGGADVLIWEAAVGGAPGTRDRLALGRARQGAPSPHSPREGTKASCGCPLLRRQMGHTGYCIVRQALLSLSRRPTTADGIVAIIAERPRHPAHSSSRHSGAALCRSLVTPIISLHASSTPQLHGRQQRSADAA